jgi:hypothetical protein
MGWAWLIRDPSPPGRPAPHAGGPDVHHHRQAVLGDPREQRQVAVVIDAEMTHDRMEVKA